MTRRRVKVSSSPAGASGNLKVGNAAMKVEQPHPVALLAPPLVDIEIRQLLHLRQHTCDKRFRKCQAGDQLRFYPMNRGSSDTGADS
jgi:hypothetical protein